MKNMNITRINEFQSADGKSDELYNFLISLIPYISKSKGCISCEVLKQKDTENCFIVIEKWESIECHMQSIANFPKEEMLSAMSLFGSPPKGNYYSA
jgi:quinol monooxygenase YgiN